MVLTTIAAVFALTPGISASAPAGQLDPAFGDNGVVRRNVGGTFVSGDQGNAILVQPDGKVLVAGQGGNPNGNFVLLRVLPDGTPDPTFGTDGLTNNSFSINNFSGAYALALQPDGRIVAGGYAKAGISHNLAIVRYLPNGALDTSFSGDGLVTGINIDGTAPSVVNSLAVQPDGKVVTVSDRGNSHGSDVVRFNADGSLDTSFGTNGRTALAGQTTSALALQSDGRIIVAAGTTDAPYRMVVTRLTATGAVDTSFGGAGTGRALVGGHVTDEATALTIGTGDLIYLGGKGTNGGGNNQVGIARLTANGTVDASFGTGGYAAVTASDSYVAVRGLGVQTDGGVVAVGGCYCANAYRWFIAHFGGSGVPDASFGGSGLSTFETGDATAVALGGGGAYVTGAQGASGDLMIYKFGTGDTPPPTTTSPPASTTAPPPTTTVGPGGDGGATLGARYVTVGPRRVLDTRTSASGKVHAGGSVEVDVRTAGGLPSTATAVVVNVTATEADGPGYVTVWAAGTPRPEVSSLNVASAAGTVANLVTMPLGDTGRLRMFSEAGAHLVVDLLGYYEPVTTPVADGRFEPVTPVRVLDTRAAGASAPSVVDFSVAGVAGIPAGRASAVVVNLTATASTSAGFVTMWPRARGGQPPTSNLNLDAPDQTRANQVIVAAGDGTIRLATTSGAHLIVDVVGYVTNDQATASTRGLFVAFTPRRVLDTRSGIGAPTGVIGPGQQRDVDVLGHVPAAGATAVVGNVTATRSLAPGFVTVWPHSAVPRPDVSTLNLDAPDQTRANHAIVTLAGDGTVSVFSETGTHVVIDLTGAYLA